MSTSVQPLRLGQWTIPVPVVLAPMAGVTNAPFRRLCREYGAGVYVTEMVTARALIERREATLRIIHTDPDEQPRSVQLYGVDPVVMGDAVQMIVEDDLADHIDLNFGCPVPKVTRKGGGAALPWKTTLFTDIIAATVRNAGQIPVTIKMRKGIDDDHLTYIDAGRIAESLGVAAVCLHARTASQYYSGTADRSAIAELKNALTIPVLGNGDIWSAEDALSMMEQTGCDGVVIGRGCQGRPWLFADLAAAMSGSDKRVRPSLREVVDVIRRHCQLMVEYFGGDEPHAMREMRKHMAWYFRGFAVGGDLRHQLGLVGSLQRFEELVQELDLDQPYPEAAEGRRGRGGSARRTILPEGWLDSREVRADQKETLAQAELSVSGG